MPYILISKTSLEPCFNLKWLSSITTWIFPHYLSETDMFVIMSGQFRYNFWLSDVDDCNRRDKSNVYVHNSKIKMMQKCLLYDPIHIQQSTWVTYRQWQKIHVLCFGESYWQINVVSFNKNSTICWTFYYYLY